MTQEDIIRQYKPLVRRWARRYSFLCDRDPSIDLDDLMQLGFIGLLRASETFDETGGASFLTWASYAIRAAIQQNTRVSRRNDCLSLDAPLSADTDDGSLLDYVEDDKLPPIIDTIEQTELQTAIRSELARLPADEQAAITAKYLKGLTAAEAAAHEGVSPAQLNGSVQRGMRKLRNHAHTLKRFIDEVETETDYYKRIGVETFHRTQTSAVESAVLWRLDRLERYIAP